MPLSLACASRPPPPCKLCGPWTAGSLPCLAPPPWTSAWRQTGPTGRTESTRQTCSWGSAASWWSSPAWTAGETRAWLLAGDEAERRREHPPPRQRSAPPPQRPLCTCCSGTLPCIRRLLPEHFLGLKQGEAEVIRNGGGRVTEDVIRCGVGEGQGEGTSGDRAAQRMRRGAACINAQADTWRQEQGPADAAPPASQHPHLYRSPGSTTSHPASLPPYTLPSFLALPSRRAPALPPPTAAQAADCLPGRAKLQHRCRPEGGASRGAVPLAAGC